MERRLRGRPSIAVSSVAAPSETTKNKTARTSPPRTRAAGSPARVARAQTESKPKRASRPRSAALGMPAAKATKSQVNVPTPIVEIADEKEQTNNLPTTLTTNTSSRAPNKSTTTSSVQSSYSTNTTSSIKTRTTDNINHDAFSNRASFNLRRSLSKSFSNIGETERTHTPTTNTDIESRFSRSVSRSIYDDDKSSKANFSENENEDEDEDTKYCSFNVTDQHLKKEQQQLFASKSLCRQLPVPREFGGWMGLTLLLLVVPTVAYYLQWSCNIGKNPNCAFKTPNLTAIIDFKYITKEIFEPQTVAIYLMFHFSVFILTAVLPGWRVHLTRETYKFNAFAMANVALLAIGIAEYYKYDIVTFLLKHYLHFCIFGILNAFTVALWCYYRRDTVKYNVLRQTLSNDYGKSGIFIVDYALGRQLNPKWLGLIDFKQAFYRASLVSTFIFAFAFVYVSIKWPAFDARVPNESLISYAIQYIMKIRYENGTLSTACLVLLYIGDAIYFEHHLASSFELQYEGFGCLLLLRYAVTPYLLCAVTNYFYKNHIIINNAYGLYLAFGILIFGLIIKRYTCAYKYKYRLNPSKPYFNNVETINTHQSTRLLLNGMWGFLRQPNYLGDIIALYGLVLPIFLHFAWPPLISVLSLIVLLVHRAKRANVRNQSRYHSAWARYCARVPNYILPKIY